MVSDRDWQESGGGDEEVPGGLIPSELGSLVEAAAADLVASAWRPYRTWPVRRWRQRKLDAEKIEVTEALAEEPRTRIDWQHVWVPR